MEPTDVLAGGDVRLWRGDCLDVLPTLDRPEFAAVLTDPPYGMNYDTDSTRFTTNENGHGEASKRTYPRVEGDDRPFDPAPWLDFPRVILWGFHHFAGRVPVGTVLVWLKKADSSFGAFLSDAELAWMKGGHGVYCRRDTSMLGITRERRHPCQKPIGLMRWCLERLKLSPGAWVLDPYMGSGTVGVACLQMGLRYAGVELDPGHYATALSRLRHASGNGPGQLLSILGDGGSD